MSVKVLQLINNLSTGGAELMVKRLALGFDPDRVQCDVLAMTSITPEVEAIYRDGLEGQGLRCASLDKKPRDKSPRALFELASRIRRERYDVVHMHCTSPSIYGRLASLLAPGPKRVVTIHLRMGRGAVWLEKLFAPLTDQFVACSSESEANLRQDCGFDERRFSCILNGTAGDRTAAVARSREAIREERGVASGEQVALFLARLEEQKAHLHLLEALVQPGEHVSRLKVWMVGNDETPYAELVRRGIEERGLGDRVQILGRVSDDEIDQLMKGADLFLLPSTHEGMSVAILEALAAGMPTVISDLETNREVTDDGRVGWLTPPNDPPGLAAALDAILDSPEEMQSRGREAQRFATEKFSFERVVREYTELYERLVERG